MIKVGAILAALAASGLAMTGMVAPTASYEVKGLHLCCNGCNGAATGAINGGGGKDAAASGGSVTFTAANGDQLDVLIEDAVLDVTTGQAAGAFRIIGGTGRFADATGSGDLVVDQNLVTGTFEGAAVGRMYY